MKIIDKTTWKREKVFEKFSSYDFPIVSLCSKLDVTNLLEYCHKNKKSFFISFLYIMVKCLNKIEEFRIRLLDDKIVEYDVISPSYVVLADDGAITACQTQMVFDFEKFHNQATVDIENTRKNSSKVEYGTARADLFYVSCVKWLDFTSVTNPYDFKDASATSIPRLTMGKYVDVGGRKMMALDICAHHGLIDGEPICRAFNDVQKEIDNINLGDKYEG